MKISPILPPKTNKHGLIIFLLLLVGFALYANCFSNQMFWDDDDFILKNRYIKDWQYLPRYFTENVLSGNYLLSNYWRPALLLVFSVEWHLWQAWAPGYHIVGTLFHSLSSVLLYLFLFALFPNRLLAVLTSLVFLIHPVQTEAVVYANALSDSLAAFFIFSSLFFYVASQKDSASVAKKIKIVFYFLSVFLYPLGLMSKETAFVLPAYILIADFFILKRSLPFPEKIKKIAVFLLPFMIIAFFYLFLRATVLNFSNTFNFYNEQNLFTSHFFVRLFTFLRVLTIYFGLLFFPWELHVERSVPLAVTFWSPSVVAGAAIFLGLLIPAWRMRANAPVVTFGVLWFFIGMFLSSNLLVPINALLYEHFLYLPLVGIFLILFHLGIHWTGNSPRRSTVIKILILYLLFFCVRTIVRNRDWRDPILFYENLLKYAPTSYRVINNLGMMYANRGFLEKAEETYKKAIALDPKNPVGYHNLGGTYRDTDRKDLAIQSFQKALEINPRFLFSYKSLAQLYLDQKNYSPARRVLEQSLAHTPEKIETLSLLSRIALAQNDFAGAQRYLQQALTLDPTNEQVSSRLKKIFISPAESAPWSNPRRAPSGL